MTAAGRLVNAKSHQGSRALVAEAEAMRFVAGQEGAGACHGDEALGACEEQPISAVTDVIFFSPANTGAVPPLPASSLNDETRAHGEVRRMSTAGCEPVTFRVAKGLVRMTATSSCVSFDLQRFFRRASSGDVPSGNP